MLTCTPTIQDAQLVLRFSFTNNTGDAVWLANDLPVTAGSGLKADSRAAYVVPEGDGVTITRRVIAVPDDLDVEAPEAPGWQRVDAGQSYSGQLVVPWPLVERRPYARGPAKAAPRHGKAYCEVGYVRAESKTAPRYSDGLASRQRLARAQITLP